MFIMSRKIAQLCQFPFNHVTGIKIRVMRRVYAHYTRLLGGELLSYANAIAIVKPVFTWYGSAMPEALRFEGANGASLYP